VNFVVALAHMHGLYRNKYRGHIPPSHYPKL